MRYVVKKGFALAASLSMMSFGMDDASSVNRFHQALLWRHTDDAPRMINEGQIKVNAVGDGGWTPLMLAASCCSVDVMSNLLRHGADPNRQNEEGNTALTVAEGRGGSYYEPGNYYDNLRLLLQYGANPRLIESNEKKREEAVRNEYFVRCAITNLFGNAGVLTASVVSNDTQDLSDQLQKIPSIVVEKDKVQRYYHIHPWLKNICANVPIEPSIAEYPHINALDAYGWTPLHWAAAQGNQEMIKLLLDYGGDPFVLNTDGLIPVRIAIRNGHVLLANRLVAFMRSGVRNMVLGALGKQIKGFAPELQKHILDLLETGKIEPLYWKFPKRNGNPGSSSGKKVK